MPAPFKLNFSRCPVLPTIRKFLPAFLATSLLLATLAPTAHAAVAIRLTAEGLRVTPDSSSPGGPGETPTPGQPPAAGITITSATYGSPEGNLTELLGAQCNGQANCTFDPLAVMGYDPVPHRAKGLELTYQCNLQGVITDKQYAWMTSEAGVRNHTLTCP